MSNDVNEPAQAHNFGSNLRFLCERQGTVSNICRKIKINRQQFNKYLSGLHLPSVQNQRLIANFFGLSKAIMFADPEEFRTLMEGNYFYAIDALRNSKRMIPFLDTLLIDEKASGDQYVGVYDRYQYSSIYKGKILRSAYCIYRNRDFLQHYYIERFPSLENSDKIEYVFKYHGFTVPLGGRLFSLDFEAVQKNEMTFGIYAPVQRSSRSFLMGITSGIAETMLRPPYSTKVAMHFRGPGLLKKENLERVTTLETGDRSIPTEVQQYFNSVD
ncbi:helix-turn-helix transcriptional regulator [Rhizobium sp. BK060]|uniref:helix-turn-helix transcriptional regulator n=1 Tax=Rhizobium sp. BK060 TaxID=2587096 RepID=UPI00161C35D4|nr:helix-turn-helix transcriptional regulator [Rhizobium sp. BK060]MBB3396035.1 transcriptional regulator with XRE-family HTH domain [Rhizobium sp. BK060]